MAETERLTESLLGRAQDALPQPMSLGPSLTEDVVTNLRCYNCCVSAVHGNEGLNENPHAEL